MDPGRRAPRKRLPGRAVRRDGPRECSHRPREKDRPVCRNHDVWHRHRGRTTPLESRMNIDLTGRVALVTGSTRGIGRCIAETLAECGARVAVVGRDAAKAHEVAAQISPEARGFACDVADVASVSALVAAVEEAFASVDVLVNNAGLTRDNIMLRLKD